MTINDLRQLFTLALSGMYDGEKKVAKMLDEAAERVPDENIASALRSHRKETEQQIKNLEWCFEILGDSPQDVNNAAIDGIHTEYNDFIGRQPSAEMLTLFTVSGTAKIEHAEIAAYLGLIDAATTMGELEVTKLLQTNLLQEMETVARLERISHEMGKRALVST